jgi:polysaccharide pyruvyl transferase WcaK-like protein
MGAAARERGAALRAGYGDYLAAQFSADCGDDASLAALAAELEQRADGKAIMLFRAGAAPWHDALEPYGRLAARLGARCHIFADLDIREICALIGGAGTYVGTSLHGCIVARACGVPAVGLERAAGAGGKLHAWRAAWAPDMPVIALDALARRESP